MNEVLKVLKERRSCRSYRPEQITDEELNAVLEAGTYAPTARGQQSPIIVAVQNPAVVEQLRKMNAAVLGTPSTVRPPCWWCWRPGITPTGYMTAAAS